MRFNPPPNWPRFPNGWTPPPGWQPDPSWPQPPYGWPLWVEDGAAARTAATATTTFVPPAPYTPYPAYRAQSGPRVPWHQRTVTVVLFLVFFFPVGIVLLWLRRDWSVRRRGLITGVTAVFVVIALATNPSPQVSTTVQVAPAAGSASSGAIASTSVTGSSTPAALSAQSSSPRPSPSSVKSSAAAVAAAPVATEARTTQAPRTTQPTTHSAVPAPAPTTHTASQAPSTCGAPSNPYGYNFCGVGGDVTSPPSDICSYFDCIANFSNGRGYMVECNDGTYSMSGGIRGACSDHGGEDRAVDNGS